MSFCFGLIRIRQMPASEFRPYSLSLFPTGSEGRISNGGGVMKKSWSTWLVASVLGCLLNLAASPGAAYYPPLQATGKGSGGLVSYNVAFPWGGSKSGSSTCPAGVTVSSFTQHNGVMAWIVGDGSTFSVKSCTFDPFLKAFVEGSQGYYTKVSQLKVNDGVVAFLAVSPSGTQVIGFTTYDPDKGNWISGERELANVSSFPDFLVKDGVVAWVAIQGGETLVEYSIRDPRASTWNVDGIRYYTSSGVDSFVITNATVYWGRASTVWFAGYQAYKNPTGTYYGGWGGMNVTTPLAFFIAQPYSGSAPLLVWFTDMSIAGTGWSWQGGGLTSANRSPYHTFNSSGQFQVSQQISGPNGKDTYSKTITIWYPMIKLRPKTVLELQNFQHWWKLY